MTRATFAAMGAHAQRELRDERADAAARAELDAFLTPERRAYQAELMAEAEALEGGVGDHDRSRASTLPPEY